MLEHTRWQVVATSQGDIAATNCFVCTGELHIFSKNCLCNRTLLLQHVIQNQVSINWCESLQWQNSVEETKISQNSPVHMKQFSPLFQVSSIFWWQPIWNLWENTFRQSGVAKTHGDHCSQVSSSSVNFGLINEVSAVADPGFSIFRKWVNKRRQFFKCTIRASLDIRFAVKQFHHCVQVWINPLYQNCPDPPWIYDQIMIFAFIMLQWHTLPI